MIIKQYAKEDEIIHGDVESVDCTIKTDDAKLFHILSNLYSRPLDAVVRELSTNCLDGHRVVGKEKVPFEIRISNSVLDDEFNISFRDFGPGMSKSTIVKVFSTFGESTKINSNLETGCLGLGSKSPFAVTSTFMVVSYIDNIKYIYNMSKDATGRPKITLFNESYTEEPNGMEITVPLDHKAYDSAKLVTAVFQELHFFKTKPIILINGQKRDFPVDTKNYKKTSYKCYKVESYNSFNSNVVKDMAIQGEIGYNLDIDKLLKACSVNNNLELFETNSMCELNILTKETLEKIHDCYNFHMYFDTGAISFAPSREELIYDQFTVKTILKRVLNNAKSMIDRYHKYMEFLSLPELAGLTINRLEFRVPVRNEAFKRFYGITTNESSFRAIYINVQYYVGKTYTPAEQEELQLHRASYMRTSENGNIRVRLNNLGSFASTYSSDSLDDEKGWPIQFKETLELLSIRSSDAYGSHVVTLASLKSNKIKTNESNMILRDYNKSAIVFVNPMLTKFPSYKLKIDNYIRFANSGVEKIYLYRGTHSQRRKDAMHRFFGRYGIDYSKDFKIIDVQTIIDFNNDLIAKQKLVEGPKVDKSGKLLPKEFREKDEIPYYRLSKVETFNNISNATKKSPFNSYNQDVLKFNPDDQKSIHEVKNMLYIPLDNKKKSTGYIDDHLSNILTYSLFKNSDGVNVLNGTSIYDILDNLCYVKYNKHWKVDTYINGCRYNLFHPFSNKTIIIMNEAKAKKIGMRSLSEYFERFILKLMDFSKFKNASLISVGADSSDIEYARWHYLAQLFNLNTNVRDINLTRLHSNGSAQIKENTERFETVRDLIQTKFTNIKSKFYQCDFTNELFEKLDELSVFGSKDKNVILLPSNSRPTQILKCIELYNPNINIVGPTFESLDKNQMLVFEEFLKLAKYLHEGTMSSWVVDKLSSSKMTSIINRIDNYLIDINHLIVKYNVNLTHTFIDEEITLAKEADATIVA